MSFYNFSTLIFFYLLSISRYEKFVNEKIHYIYIIIYTFHSNLNLKIKFILKLSSKFSRSKNVAYIIWHFLNISGIMYKSGHFT